MVSGSWRDVGVEVRPQFRPIMRAPALNRRRAGEPRWGADIQRLSHGTRPVKWRVAAAAALCKMRELAQDRGCVQRRLAERAMTCGGDAVCPREEDRLGR